MKDVNQRDIYEGLFPTDAFSYSKPGTASPVIGMKSGWTMSAPSVATPSGTITALTASTGLIGILTVPGSTTLTGNTTLGSTATIASGHPRKGQQWVKVADPATGWLASKTTWATADSFSAGLTVDFSSLVPVGTKAVKTLVYAVNSATSNIIYYRKGGDTNISNTPNASSEFSHMAWNTGAAVVPSSAVLTLWLSATYTVDFAVIYTDADVYVAPPVEYLL